MAPAKGDTPEAGPGPKLNFGAAVVAAAGFAAPKGDCDAGAPAPNTLGFPEAPKVPKGEAEEAARLPNADLAKADCDVWSADAFALPVDAPSVLGFSKLDVVERVGDDDA